MRRVLKVAVGLTVAVLITGALWLRFDGDRTMHQGCKQDCGVIDPYKVCWQEFNSTQPGNVEVICQDDFRSK